MILYHLFWVHVWLYIWHHSCKHNPTLILKTMSAKSSLLITDYGQEREITDIVIPLSLYPIHPRREPVIGIAGSGEGIGLQDSPSSRVLVWDVCLLPHSFSCHSPSSLNTVKYKMHYYFFCLMTSKVNFVFLLETSNVSFLCIHIHKNKKQQGIMKDGQANFMASHSNCAPSSKQVASGAEVSLWQRFKCITGVGCVKQGLSFMVLRLPLSHIFIVKQWNSR